MTLIIDTEQNRIYTRILQQCTTSHVQVSISYNIRYINIRVYNIRFRSSLSRCFRITITMYLQSQVSQNILYRCRPFEISSVFVRVDCHFGIWMRYSVRIRNYIISAENQCFNISSSPAVLWYLTEVSVLCTLTNGYIIIIIIKSRFFCVVLQLYRAVDNFII